VLRGVNVGVGTVLKHNITLTEPCFTAEGQCGRLSMVSFEDEAVILRDIHIRVIPREVFDTGKSEYLLLLLRK
jgi:hypothetical protein